MVTPIFKNPLVFCGMPQIQGYTVDSTGVGSALGATQPAAAAIESGMPPIGRSITANPLSLVEPQSAFPRSPSTLADIPSNFGKSASEAVLPFEYTIVGVQREVEKKYGKPISRRRMRDVYAQGDEIVGRLTDAFASLHHSDIDITHRFHIVDSDEENAFVYSLAGRLRNRRTNMVYITTGLLRKIFSEDGVFTSESIEKGRATFAGVIAHEMAHPLDKLDSNSLQSIHGRWSASQALEVRADIEAVIMLRYANLPRHGMLDAIGLLAFEKPQETDVVDAAASTHPEDDLRVVSLKIGMTIDDFERGEAVVRPLSAINERLFVKQLTPAPEEAKVEEAEPVKELKQSSGFDFESEAYKAKQRRKLLEKHGMEEPTTIVEALERLSLLSGVPKGGMRDEDSWSRVVGAHYECLDALLIQKGADLSEEEISKLLRLNESLLKQETVLGMYIDSADRKGKVASIQFYRTERYRSWIRSKIAELLEMDESPSRWKGFWTFQKAPIDVSKVERSHPKINAMIREGGSSARWEEWFEPEDVPYVKGALNPHEERLKDWEASLQALLWIASPEIVADELRPLFARIIRECDEEQSGECVAKFVDMFRVGHGEWSSWDKIGMAMRLWFYEEGAWIVSSSAFWEYHVRKGDLTKVKKATDPWLQDFVKRGMAGLWERRGEIALAGILRGDNSIVDWHEVFGILGKDPKEGYEEIVEAIKEFTTSRAYVSFLEQMAPHTFKRETERVLKERDTIVKGCEWMPQNLDVDEWLRSQGSLPWYRDELRAYLAGEHNEYLDRDSLPQGAIDIVLGRYFDRNGPLWFRMLRENIEMRISGAAGEAGLDAEGVLSIVQDALDMMPDPPIDERQTVEVPKGHSRHITIVQRLQVILAETIGASNLSPDVKKHVLQGLYVDVEGRFGWLNGVGPHHGSVYSVLRETGVIENGIDLLSRELESYRKFHEMNPDYWGGPRKRTEYADREKTPYDFTYRYYESILGKYEEELMDELRRIESLAGAPQGKEELSRFVELFDPFSSYIGVSKKDMDGSVFCSSDEDLKRIRSRIFQVAARMPLEYAERLELFERLTLDTNYWSGLGEPDEGVFNGVDPDAYFKDYLQDEMVSHHKGDLERVLGDGRIYGQRLIVDLARHLFEDEMVPETGMTEDSLTAFIERINKYVPERSVFRDELLEDVAWVCDVGSDLIHLIEDEKSTNWRASSPLQVRVASGLSKWSDRMDEAQRLVMIRYLMNPAGRACPPEVAPMIDQSRDDSHGFVKFGAREFSAVANDLKSMQRVPLIALLLEKGEPSLMEKGDFPLNITRRILGYEADSDAEKILTAGLRSIPPEQSYQKPVVLAYLMSIQNEEKRGIKAIFEAFTAVGIKLGQLAGIFWDDISENTRAELKELKDNARRLNKAEIYTIMKENLEAHERSRIKRLKKVLGSASLRTAVLVELDDGSEVVMLVQRPHAREQIEANVKRVQRLIPELKKEGFGRYVKIIEAFLGPAVEQLRRELEMTREAKILGTAQRFYRRMNSLLKPYLGDWTFVVPGLVECFQVRDNIMFIDKVEGASFDDMADDDDKRGVGRCMVMAGLISLFRAGFMNTDPHGGNYLIDPKGKTIGVIDWGQFEKFNTLASVIHPDDPYNLTQFLWGIADGDVDKVMKYGIRMNGNTEEAINDSTRARLARALNGETDFAGKLIGTINALFESNVKLSRRFSAGAIVGLMILAREGYVDDRSFKHLLSFEAALVIAKKAPLALKSAIKRRFVASVYAFLGFKFAH